MSVEERSSLVHELVKEVTSHLVAIEAIAFKESVATEDYLAAMRDDEVVQAILAKREGRLHAQREAIFNINWDK